MTSGEFHAYPVGDIVVEREARQRKVIDDIDTLAESISKVGLINPLVITRDGVLVAGERRLTAIKSLGWDKVPVQFTDELDEVELHLIELEENVRRKQLTWQEEAAAVEEYHRLRGHTSLEETAEELGMSLINVSRKIAVASQLSDPVIAGADKFSTAANLVARKRERAATAAIASLTTEPAEVPLLNVDFTEWAADYAGPKFNFLHCDFPYGVNANKQQQGNNVAAFGTYEDSPDIYFHLLRTLCDATPYLVDESAHLMFWFSMDYYTATLEALSSVGWKVNPFPLVWMKDDNTGLLPDPARGPRRIYETAFFAARGDRKIVRAVSNAFAHPGKDKSIHMSEKPQPMLEHFFRMIVDEHTTILDPTAGSANAIITAKKLGAARVLGLERDPEFYNRAKENYLANTTGN